MISRIRFMFFLVASYSPVVRELKQGKPISSSGDYLDGQYKAKQAETLIKNNTNNWNGAAVFRGVVLWLNGNNRTSDALQGKLEACHTGCKCQKLPILVFYCVASLCKAAMAWANSPRL